MKVYTVRKTRNQAIVAVSVTYQAAEAQADKFYIDLNLDCYISVEYI